MEKGTCSYNGKVRYETALRVIHPFTWVAILMVVISHMYDPNGFLIQHIKDLTVWY
jgi:hypothetical protein